MLQKLADHISDCFARAAAAERRAAAVSDPALKQEYEQFAKGWRHLAASYQFAESLERFIVDTERTKKTPPSAPTAPD